MLVSPPPLKHVIEETVPTMVAKTMIPIFYICTTNKQTYAVGTAEIHWVLESNVSASVP